MSSKIPLNNRLIVALDANSPQRVLDLVKCLKDKISIFKVGLQLFVAGGTEIITTLKRNGIKIFLDLKFHDIPTTVAKASIEAIRRGADYLIVGRPILEASDPIQAAVQILEDMRRSGTPG